VIASMSFSVSLIGNTSISRNGVGAVVSGGSDQATDAVATSSG